MKLSANLALEKFKSMKLINELSTLPISHEPVSSVKKKKEAVISKLFQNQKNLNTYSFTTYQALFQVFRNNRLLFLTCLRCMPFCRWRDRGRKLSGKTGLWDGRLGFLPNLVFLPLQGWSCPAENGFETWPKWVLWQSDPLCLIIHSNKHKW